jgi:hypothetical protein
LGARARGASGSWHACARACTWGERQLARRWARLRIIVRFRVRVRVRVRARVRVGVRVTV